MSDSHNGRPEPEIIPPGTPDPTRWTDPRRGGQEGPRVWAWSSDPRYAGLRRGRPGPLALIAIFAALAALGVLGFFIFVGVLAITLPLVGAVVLVGLFAGILRRL